MLVVALEQLKAFNALTDLLLYTYLHRQVIFAHMERNSKHSVGVYKYLCNENGKYFNIIWYLDKRYFHSPYLEEYRIEQTGSINQRDGHNQTK